MLCIRRQNLSYNFSNSLGININIIKLPLPYYNIHLYDKSHFLILFFLILWQTRCYLYIYYILVSTLALRKCKLYFYEDVSERKI